MIRTLRVFLAGPKKTLRSSRASRGSRFASPLARQSAKDGHAITNQRQQMTHITANLEPAAAIRRRKRIATQLFSHAYGRAPAFTSVHLEKQNKKKINGYQIRSSPYLPLYSEDHLHSCIGYNHSSLIHLINQRYERIGPTRHCNMRKSPGPSCLIGSAMIGHAQKHRKNSHLCLLIITLFFSFFPRLIKKGDPYLWDEV